MNLKPVVFLALAALLQSAAAAEPSTALEKLESPRPTPAVFQEASGSNPLVITGPEEAKAFFTEEGVRELEETIDFNTRKLLVFAWRGSGGDRMVARVAESHPEQVSFHVQPGFTRDLRPHIVVYSIRNDVAWSVK